MQNSKSKHWTFSTHLQEIHCDNLGLSVCLITLFSQEKLYLREQRWLQDQLKGKTDKIIGISTRFKDRKIVIAIEEF